MNLLETLLSRRRMLLTAAAILSLMGLFAWFTMPRQEDPRMPDYWANIVAVFPGANAEQVERLVLEPLEEHLAEVDGLNFWQATAQSEQAFVYIEMQSDVKNIDDVWDDVEDSLEDAARDFPDGARLLNLDTELNDQDAVVLAITGSMDLLVLADIAKQIKDRLIGLKEVAEVRLISDPHEQITIAFDDAQVNRLGLAPESLALQLQSRNTTLPGGSVKLGGRTVNLSPETEFLSIKAIRETPISLPQGGHIPLAEIAAVYHGPEEPAKSLMRFQGAMAVGIGVVPKKGVHLVSFGQSVRQEVARLRETVAPIQIEEVAFLPDRVQSRLQELGKSLAMGIFIVGLILLLAMGLRLGFVVAVVVPLVAFSSLGLFAAGGGTLHQISISALVIALGMLVDNAIVIAENIQWRIDRGSSPHQAAIDAIRELAAPLGSATATTLAAFVPMMINKGMTAEFTRSLPIVIMLTLTVSYLFAIFVTPMLSELFLRRRKSSGPDRMNAISSRMAQITIGRPLWILAGASTLVGLSLLSSGMVKKQFFPSSDRNQIIVEVQLPEGAHLDETSAICSSIERHLETDPNVKTVASFIGRNTPHFYYNLTQIPWRPHFAQLLVTTQDLAVIPAVIRNIRNFSQEAIPEAIIVPKKLEQGPPINTPIEVRIYAESFAQLNDSADEVINQLRAIPGAIDIRHDLSLGAPNLHFLIDDGAAARHGFTRASVATSLFGRTRGLPIGQYRAGDDPVPIVLRSQKGEHFPAEDLETLLITAPGSTPVPLASIARVDLRWRPAAIKHRDRKRVVQVSAQLAEGYTYSDVQRELTDRLNGVAFPDGIQYEFGGEAEGSGEANASMVTALPWGIMLLFAILLAQFNSFRRVGIILITVPLAATGVIPGLLLGGQPFGFMSFLGVIALIGVVVNNAIVLMDVIETRRKEGATIEQALHDGIGRRMRPILLTTATTVAGLTPLALSESALWPPLALAMISGLIASTMLTLLVVPALYYLLFKSRSKPSFKPIPSLAKATLFAIIIFLPLGLRAQQLPAANLTHTLEPKPLELSWQAILERAKSRQKVAAWHDRYAAANQQVKGLLGVARLPQVGVQVAANYSTPVASFDTPQGRFSLGDRQRYSGSLLISQPLLDLTSRRAAAAMDIRAKTILSQADNERLIVQREAVNAMVYVAGIDAQRMVNQAFIQSLESQFLQIRVLVENGRALEADLLKIQLELDQATQTRFQIEKQHQVAAHALGQAIGYSGQVTPKLDPIEIDTRLPTLETAIQMAMENRPELAILFSQQLAYAKQAQTIDSEKLPTLDLRAGWLLSDGDAFRPDSSFDAALIVGWKPFAGGYRKARKASARLEASATAKLLLDARQAISIEIRSIFANIHIAKEAQKVAARGVQLASENLRVEQERHRAGRATTNDLLLAEALKRGRETDLVLAKLDFFRYSLNLKLATGN